MENRRGRENRRGEGEQEGRGEQEGKGRGARGEGRGTWVMSQVCRIGEFGRRKQAIA